MTTSVKETSSTPLRMTISLPRRLRFRVMRDSRAKIAWSFFIFLFLVIFIDSFGFVKVYFERDFETEFSYPLDVEDFPSLVHRFRNGEKVEFQPINRNYSNVEFHEQANDNCGDQLPIGLLILVKSAPDYFEKREAIRETWGNVQYLQNISNSIPHSSPLLSCFQHQAEKKKHSGTPKQIPFRIKLIFLIGYNENQATSLPPSRATVSSEVVGDSNSIESQLVKSAKDHLVTVKDTTSQNQRSTSRHRRLRNRIGLKSTEASLKEEILKYRDIVRADFVDSYENNTYKTMIGLRWAMEICSNFQFGFLVDDDMFINVKNLIKFMEAPKQYPVSDAIPSNEVVHNSPPDKLYAGKVLLTRPIRYKLVSKWYLSLEEYPFNYFPPYMPAAAILMSKSAVEDFYYASFYTKHFRFDDVYLGFLAQKMNIIPLNSNYFHVCHTPDGRCPDSEVTESRSRGRGSSEQSEDNLMKDVIARHGLSGPAELVKLWNMQKPLGNLEF